MPQIIYHNSDGNRLYLERELEVRTKLNEINQRLALPEPLQEIYCEYFGTTVQAGCVIHELLEDTVDIVFKSEKHFVAIGQLDFWRSQLLRLRNPIDNHIKDVVKRRKLTIEINRKYLHINSYIGSRDKIEQAYNDAMALLEEEVDNELSLLTRLEYRHAAVDKWDINDLLNAQADYHTLFAEAQQSENTYALKRAYAMLARYYEHLGHAGGMQNIFTYAQLAFIQLWYVHQDGNGLSFLGVMANDAINKWSFDYAKTLLKTWARYRQNYHVHNLYADALYLGTWGHLHYKHEKYELARACLTSAYELYDRLGHEENMGRVLLLLGLTYNKLQDYQQGLTVYETAKSVYKDIDKNDYIIRAQHGLGWTHLNMGNHAQAIDIMEDALAKAGEYTQALAGTIRGLNEDIAKAKSFIN